MKYTVKIEAYKDASYVEVEARSPRAAIQEALAIVDDTPLFLRVGRGRWVGYGDDMFQFCTPDPDSMYPKLIANSRVYRAIAQPSA